MAWLKDTMLLCSITVGILLLYPTQLQAQSKTTMIATV